MTKSYRTQKPSAVAERKLARDADGKPLLPRIVERVPRKGDVHPIPASALRRVLQREVPLEYIYGLSRIELRPRPSNSIGNPFACYLRDEKAIILYSLPTKWCWNRSVSDTLLKPMKRFFAVIEIEASRTTVLWPAKELLAVWYYTEVLAHELGHHYRRQYRGRRGSGALQSHEEFVAELHSHRFYKAFRAKLRARARAKDSPG